MIIMNLLFILEEFDLVFPLYHKSDIPFNKIIYDTSRDHIVTIQVICDLDLFQKAKNHFVI